jgi:hypothetical protein
MDLCCARRCHLNCLDLDTTGILARGGNAISARYLQGYATSRAAVVKIGWGRQRVFIITRLTFVCEQHKFAQICLS